MTVDRSAVIFGGIEQEACAVRGVWLFAAGVFFVMLNRLHTFLEGFVCFP
jgi:hypothetical protein